MSIGSSDPPGDTAISDPDLVASVLDPHDGEDDAIPVPGCPPGVEVICVAVSGEVVTLDFRGTQSNVDDFSAEIRSSTGGDLGYVVVTELFGYEWPSTIFSDATSSPVVATPEPGSAFLLLIALSALLGLARPSGWKPTRTPAPRHFTRISLPGIRGGGAARRSGDQRGSGRRVDPP